jgi:hypothetical protein
MAIKKFMLIGDEYRGIFLYDPATQKEMPITKNTYDAGFTDTYLRNGYLFEDHVYVSLSSGGGMSKMTLEGEVVVARNDGTGRINQYAKSLDGTKLACADFNSGEVKILDINTFEVLSSFPVTGNDVARFIPGMDAVFCGGKLYDFTGAVIQDYNLIEDVSNYELHANYNIMINNDAIIKKYSVNLANTGNEVTIDWTATLDGIDLTGYNLNMYSPYPIMMAHDESNFKIFVNKTGALPEVGGLITIQMADGAVTFTPNVQGDAEYSRSSGQYSVGGTSADVIGAFRSATTSELIIINSDLTTTQTGIYVDSIYSGSVVTLETTELSGNVTSGGSPLVGVDVFACRQDNMKVIDKTVTDSNGDYTLHVLEPNTKHVVICESPDPVTINYKITSNQ